MMRGLLEGEGLHVLIRRAPGFDVPDFLAGGPRELLVPESEATRARALVESHFGIDRPYA
jgi:hypothetical protein